MTPIMPKMREENAKGGVFRNGFGQNVVFDFITGICYTNYGFRTEESELFVRKISSAGRLPLLSGNAANKINMRL